MRHRSRQGLTYIFTSTLVNTLLLSQVVLGAALTGLGASDSSRVLITVFGALNTVIAGLIAFLKSRGQPVRARMFRDDLERVVDEIENSAVMWLGISRGAHGYDAIDTDSQVTVRSEVARLTRLYDRAVKTNTMNDPDMYASGAPGDPGTAGLRTRPAQPSQPPVPVAPASSAPVGIGNGAAAPVPALTAPLPDPDDSPATKPPEPKDNGKDKAAPAPEQPAVNGRTTAKEPDASAPTTDAAKTEAKDKPSGAAHPSNDTDEKTAPATAPDPAKADSNATKADDSKPAAPATSDAKSEPKADSAHPSLDADEHTAPATGSEPPNPADDDPKKADDSDAAASRDAGNSAPDGAKEEPTKPPEAVGKENVPPS